MFLLSQRDPTWSNVKLGQSNLTVGRFGCTTVSISMLTDYFGSYKAPSFLATKGLQYTKEGLLIWSSINSLSCMSFEKRLYNRNDTEIMTSLKDPMKACILEVEGRHWVVAVRKSILPDRYVILDPWFGDKASSKRYKTITGSAHFKAK